MDPSSITKKDYEPPKIESEEYLEKSAMACGKCETGPTQQANCTLLGVNS